MLKFPNLRVFGLQFAAILLILVMGSCSATAQSGGKPKPADFGIKSKKALDFYEKGLAQAKYRDYRKAIEMYDEAIALEPNFGDAHFQAGACAYAVHDYEKAYPYLIKTKAILKDPNPMLYFFLGECAFQRDSFQVAVDNYNEFLSFKPAVPANILKTTEEHRKNAAFAIQAMKKAIKFEPINLGDNVNSIGEEYLPNLTADGKTIFFTSRRPGCTGGYSAEYRDFTEDFYYSEMVDGKWQPCKNLGPPVNTELNEGAASFSPDGQYVFFASCGRKGGYGDCDLYVSKLNGTTWSAPQNLGPIVNSPQWDSQPSISNDGKTLFFSSTRPGGKGGQDIWYSRLVNNSWTEPKNLGEPVNTSGSEVSPFLHADGKTLYFASDNHPGFGGLDLFVTKNTGEGWTTPQNLGYPLNTSASEGNIFVNTKGDMGFINSSRQGGFGKSDIFQFELDAKIRPNYTTYVRGKVTNKETGQAIDAKVLFINLATRDTVRSVQTNSASGVYMLTLPLEEDYAAFVDQKGYLFASQFFSLKAIDPKVTPYFDVDIELQPLKVGIDVVMSSIFYETNKYALLPTSKPELDHLLSFMLLNKSVRVEIGGHTDDVGSDKDNQTLSLNRALEVRKYLIEKGIKADRIEAQGYGESRPMVPNDSEAGRALNRRTVCRIIGV